MKSGNNDIRTAALLTTALYVNKKAPPLIELAYRMNDAFGEMLESL